MNEEIDDLEFFCRHCRKEFSAISALSYYHKNVQIDLRNDIKKYIDLSSGEPAIDGCAQYLYVERFIQGHFGFACPYCHEVIYFKTGLYPMFIGHEKVLSLAVTTVRLGEGIVKVVYDFKRKYKLRKGGEAVIKC